MVVVRGYATFWLLTSNTDCYLILIHHKHFHFLADCLAIWRILLLNSFLLYASHWLSSYIRNIIDMIYLKPQWWSCLWTCYITFYCWPELNVKLLVGCRNALPTRATRRPVSTEMRKGRWLLLVPIRLKLIFILTLNSPAPISQVQVNSSLFYLI